MILKPSQAAPLDAYLLAEMIDAAGFPPGVFNLVNGAGPMVGKDLATHPDVDMISLTGSTRAGAQVAGAQVAGVQVAQHRPNKPASAVVAPSIMATAANASTGR
mgnify:CR=1 FL=1